MIVMNEIKHKKLGENFSAWSLYSIFFFLFCKCSAHMVMN